MSYKKIEKSIKLEEFVYECDICGNQKEAMFSPDDWFYIGTASAGLDICSDKCFIEALSLFICEKIEGE